MAREFVSKRYFPNAGINTLYFLDFEDIIINKFGSAYNIISRSSAYNRVLKPHKIGWKKLSEIKKKEKEFRQGMYSLLNETQEYPIDPKIRKLAEACYKKGMSFEWTEIKQANKFFYQMCIANSLGKKRVERLEACN